MDELGSLMVNDGVSEEISGKSKREKTKERLMTEVMYMRCLMKCQRKIEGS